MHPNQWTRKVGMQLAADKKNKSLYGGIQLPGSKRAAKADHVACKKHRAWHTSPRKFTVKASSLDWI